LQDSGPEDAQGYYDRAMQALEGGLLDQAEADLAMCVRLDPEMVAAWVGLAQVTCEMDRYETALDHCRQALDLDPRNVAAYLWSSVACRELGMLDEATEAASRAQRLAGTDAERADALAELGHAHSRAERFDEAIACFRQLIELSPGDAWVHNSLGWCYLQKELWAEAEQAFRAALETDDEDEAAYAYVQLSRIAFERGDRERAVELCRQGTTLGPNYSFGHSMLSWLYRGIGKHDEAIEAARQAVVSARDRVEESDSYRDLGEACLDAHRYGEAVAYYERAADLEPEDPWPRLWLSCACRKAGLVPRAAAAAEQALDGARDEGERVEAYLQLGEAHFSGGDVERAIDAYRSALMLIPDDVRLLLELARSYGQLGDLDNAGEMLRRVLAAAEDAGDRADAYTQLAWIANEGGRLDEAIDAALSAHSLDPTDVGALLQLCWAYRGRGRPQEAIQAAEAALPLAGDDGERADVYLEMGAACAQLGRYEQAIECFERSIDLGRGNAFAYDLLGRALLGRQLWPEAERAFGEQLALSEDDEESGLASINLANLCIDRGRLEEAERWIAQARELGHESAAVHNALGVIASERGHWEDAEAELGRAAELDPQDPWPRYNLALNHEETGDREAAIAYYGDALRADGSHVPSHWALALLYHDSDPERAVEHYRQVIALEPDNVAARRRLAAVHDALGDHLAAEQLRREADSAAETREGTRAPGTEG
jgi:tetratricopeptide (TPR) repeat protein